MFSKGKGNPYHDKRGRFTSASNCYNTAIEVDENNRNIYYENNGNIFLRQEEKVNGKWKLKDENCITDDMGFKDLIGKIFKSKEEKEAEEKERVALKKEKVESEVHNALVNGEKLPRYEDEESRKMKMAYLQREFGDDEAQAGKRWHENYYVQFPNGEIAECFDTQKKIDEEGNVYYEITDQKDQRRTITEDMYNKKEPVRRINGLKVVGIKYDIGKNLYISEESLNEVIRRAGCKNLEEYRKKHEPKYGFRIVDETEDGGLYFNGERISIVNGKPDVLPWDSDIFYSQREDKVEAWRKDHPYSIYNKESLWIGISRIKYMYQKGDNILKRRKEFDRLKKSVPIRETALLYLLGKEYMEP